MAVSLGKNKSFRNFFTAGEKLGKERVLKGFDYSSDLTGIDNIFIQFRGLVVHAFIQLLPAFFSGQAVAVLHLLFQDRTALLSDFGFDQENIFTDVHAVDDSLLTGIFTDNVFIEKGKGTLVRCGSQTDDKGVKVFQHLLPDIINRTVALINDNHIKEFRGILGIINNLFRTLLVSRGKFTERGFFS